MSNQIRTTDIAFEPHPVPELQTGSGSPWISAERLALLLRTDPRDDSDVRGDVRRALMLDSLVPLSVDAQVQGGIVTLTGTVSWHREITDAIALAGSVPGVLGVIDDLVLIPKPRAGDRH